MPKYQIKGSFSVEYLFEVEGETFEEARGKLCDRELFTQFGLSAPHTYGLSDYDLAAIGAEVLEEEHFSDPAPTGRQWTRREWEWEELGDEDG